MTDIWKTLASRGRIADLSIGRPRATVPLTLFVDEITKKRTPDEILPDLGISTKNDKQRQAVDEYVRVGVKVLLPPRYEQRWRSAETGARRTLLHDASETGNGYIYAFRTPYGAFIPMDNFDRWLEKITELRDRYMEVKDDLLREYASVKREVVQNFDAIARLTYTNLMKSDPALLRGVSRDEFVERYLRVVKANIPTPEEIEQQTYFNWRLTEIALPEDVRKSVIADAALKPEEKERIKALNRMSEIVLATSKADLTKLEADVNQQLLSVVYNATEQAFRYLSASGTVPPKMSIMLDKLIEQVQGLNVLDNKEVVGWAERLHDAVQNLRSAGRDKTDAYTELQAAVVVARDGAARRLQRYGGALRSSRHIEVGDEVSKPVERRQRVA